MRCIPTGKCRYSRWDNALPMSRRSAAVRVGTLTNLLQSWLPGAGGMCRVPPAAECVASFACKVTATTLVNGHNLLTFEVLKSPGSTPTKTPPKQSTTAVMVRSSSGGETTQLESGRLNGMAYQAQSARHASRLPWAKRLSFRMRMNASCMPNVSPRAHHRARWGTKRSTLDGLAAPSLKCLDFPLHIRVNIV
jgi:hypothetical protein